MIEEADRQSAGNSAQRQSFGLVSEFISKADVLESGPSRTPNREPARAGRQEMQVNLASWRRETPRATA
jgi:hypothetical protein